MSKYCASCGKPLKEGAKFCAGCGKAVLNAPPEKKPVSKKNSPFENKSVSEETLQPKVKAMAEKKSSNTEVLVSKTTKILGKIKTKVKTKVNTETKAYTKKYFSDTVPAYGAAGELALPLEFTPLPADFNGEGLFPVLKSGLSGLMGGFKRTLGDKKRLAIVIALTGIWLLVNVLAISGIFPFPIRLLSWLTAARGSLIGGSIGKGLVAALLAQIVVDKGVLTILKSGLGQLSGIVNSGKREVVPLMLGAGAALIACNMMVSTNLQNTMVCIAGFALSAKALTQNGFLRRFITGLLPKAEDGSLSSIMGGWTLGFAVFAVVSLLPGGKNGYLIGFLLLVIGVILEITNKNKKEVVTK
ncbi:MAG: hypothetical protein ACOX8P_13350 [Tepidanaerobacteraceae bacterium]|jgi:uncharacterized Zn finger protein (UPF0148 family)